MNDFDKLRQMEDARLDPDYRPYERKEPEEPKQCAECGMSMPKRSTYYTWHDADDRFCSLECLLYFDGYDFDTGVVE